MYYNVMLLDTLAMVIIGLASCAISTYLIEMVKYIDGIFFDVQYRCDDNTAKLISIFASISAIFLYMHCFSPISSSI